MVKKVYITRKIPQPGIDLFFENGFDVEIYDEDMNEYLEQILWDSNSELNLWDLT